MGIAAAALVVGAILDWQQFVRSYLWAYVFYLGLALGCMEINMLQFLTGGAWGIVLVPYPDTETPPPGQNCQGGVHSGPPGNFRPFTSTSSREPD